jgi:GNAT superfamily N-acetyltransferase
MMSDLDIRLARPGDEIHLLALNDDADRWLVARGIVPGVPPKPLEEIFASRIARRVTYLAERSGEIIGSFTYEDEDDRLWHDLPASAGYVHGLVVRRDCAGQKIGFRLLAQAKRIAAERGKALLRLDCDAENPQLRAYYEHAGFTYRGDVTLPHRRASRYESPVEERDSAG